MSLETSRQMLIAYVSFVPFDAVSFHLLELFNENPNADVDNLLTAITSYDYGTTEMPSLVQFLDWNSNMKNWANFGCKARNSKFLWKIFRLQSCNMHVVGKVSFSSGNATCSDLRCYLTKLSKSRSLGQLPYAMTQASVDRECRTCLQRHLSNIF